jgi:aldehyde:ferredoxin oxidoreductase
LWEDTDTNVKITCIGPGGESGVRFAAIVGDGYYGAGWSGAGLVMGSKNLKGIAVRGTQGIRVAEPQKFLDAVMEIRKKMKAHTINPKGELLFNSIVLVDTVEQQINPAVGISVRPKGCFGCSASFGSIAVGQNGQEILQLKSPAKSGWVYGMKQNRDAEDLSSNTQRAVELGLNPLIMKGMWAAIKKSLQTGELQGSLADRLALMDERLLAKKIAYRDGGIGEMFAQGPEALPLGLAKFNCYQTDYSGCSIGGLLVIPKSHKLAEGGDASTKESWQLARVLEEIGLCPFLLRFVDIPEVAAMLSAATGIHYSPEDLIQSGEAIVTG